MNTSSMIRVPHGLPAAWRQRHSAVALAVMSLCLPPGVQASVIYDVIDLSTYGPQGVYSIATGINNAGNIVGNLIDASGQQTGGWFLPAGATQWTSLPSAQGGVAPVRTVAINNNNLILGANLYYAPDPYGPGGAQSPELERTLTWTVPFSGAVQPGSRINSLPDGWLPLALNDSGAMLLRGTLATTNGVTTVVDRLDTYNGLVRVWQAQGYPTTMPLAINNAGETVGGLAFNDLLATDYGVRYTGLNNSGLRIGQIYVPPPSPGAATPQALPVLTWREPDGSLFNGSPNYVERIVNLNTLLAPGQVGDRIVSVSAVNDLGQIVGLDKQGHAVLLTHGGSVELVATPGAGGFGTTLSWDTDLARLPNKNFDFVIAPNNPAGSVISNLGPFSPNPLADLNNASIKSLTVGTVGVPLTPTSPRHTVFLSSINLLTTTGPVRVGESGNLNLSNSGFDSQQGGLEVLGSLTMSGVMLRGNLANHGGTVVVADGAVVNVNGNVVNDLPLHPLYLGGQTLWVNTGARLSVTGDVTNTANVLIQSGASLEARSFTQTNGLLVVDGTLDTFGGNVDIRGGYLKGGGTINLGGTYPDGSHYNGHIDLGGGPGFAFFAPGHSPGHLTVIGDLVIGDNGVLELQVERQADGSLAWDRVTANHISFLDGSQVHFLVGAGVASSNLQTVSFLECGSGCSFASNVSFVVDGAPGADFQFGAGGLQLALPPAVAVPEPATAMLWLAGLLAVARVARRRPLV